MIKLVISNRKPGKLERLLWISVGLISLLPLSVVLSENPADFFTDFFTDFRTACCAFFAGIATFGLLFNWGPVVPSSILGIAVLTLLTDPIASSHEEAVFKVLVIPLIGAAIGAMIGLMIDWRLTHPQVLKSNSDELEVGDSNEIAT